MCNMHKKLNKNYEKQRIWSSVSKWRIDETI